jgi:26S proteasome regulatory subunit N8
MFNSLPNMNGEGMVNSLTMKNNDNTFVLYISAIVRSIIALHNLINNKLQNKESDRALTDNKEKDKKEAKDAKESKEGKDAKEGEKESEKKEEKSTKK